MGRESTQNGGPLDGPRVIGDTKTVPLLSRLYVGLERLEEFFRTGIPLDKMVLDCPTSKWFRTSCFIG